MPSAKRASGRKSCPQPPAPPGHQTPWPAPPRGTESRGPRPGAASPSGTSLTLTSCRQRIRTTLPTKTWTWRASPCREDPTEEETPHPVRSSPSVAVFCPPWPPTPGVREPVASEFGRPGPSRSLGNDSDPCHLHLWIRTPLWGEGCVTADRDLGMPTQVPTGWQLSLQATAVLGWTVPEPAVFSAVEHGAGSLVLAVLRAAAWVGRRLFLSQPRASLSGIL
ncbi:uncharacterized protein LOC124502875 [Lynx rufus]|uniref:uncharacterized protein LOC124502875 n=1 Tax=Lynx rufus TaxID=61384 RepID=UPI001F12780E|nr:uncharacterized protein LOC124502875 [Lynx rufus]